MVMYVMSLSCSCHGKRSLHICTCVSVLSLKTGHLKDKNVIQFAVLKHQKRKLYTLHKVHILPVIYTNIIIWVMGILQQLYKTYF